MKVKDNPSSIKEANNDSTPMLKQYQSIKANHKDSILFFRLGDFYEMFFEDAKIASSILDLVLTSRGKGPSGKIPMCGIPYHSAQNYIARLIKAGHKVAICEQVEEVGASKGIVKRDVIRTITSGTYIDENSNDARYLLCLSKIGNDLGISFIDPTAGQIKTNQFKFSIQVLNEICGKMPLYEIIYPESLTEEITPFLNNPSVKLNKIVISPYEDWCFNPDIAKKTLCEHFNVLNLHGFGIEDLTSAISSTGALLEYLKAMNKTPLKHVDQISLYSNDDSVYISPAAINGLELNRLIETINHTQTAFGKRLFKQWFLNPLKQTDQIIQRQDAISNLRQDSQLYDELKVHLKNIPDIEKNISRLSCGYSHPKDLMAIRNTLCQIPSMIKTIEPLKKANVLFTISHVESLANHLKETINESIPLSKYEGKVIAPGVNKELDELKNIQENGRAWLTELQQKEIKATGISSLKIGFNKVFGYYIEITKTHQKSVPEHYIRKQTLVNAERYITQELKEYEEKILSAQDKIEKIEANIIQEVKQKILDHSVEIHKLCNQLALIDCLYSLTILSNEANYIAPTINNEDLIKINSGRHPVVELSLLEPFIANDTLLNSTEDHLIILTGPNMAGKSTYIRQTAILTIMAQVGSFIPSESATIGVVDKVFTRIGAHDDISKGQSTFMVEMNEAADILNNMTDKSLVVLDEIGRGTSTYDGLSLAWALAEHFINKKTRTLFATHFHELTALASKHEGIKNYNVSVKEWKDEIIFLHKIVEGSTDDSYGIYVAKLAGIPDSIIKRSKQILTQLELKSDIKENLTKNHHEDQMQLFNANDTIAVEIKEALQDLDLNTLTPLDAMNMLSNLKKKADQ